MRVRRSFAVAVLTLASVSWGVSASAAPAQQHANLKPILIVHKMSSCGAMNAL